MDAKEIAARSAVAAIESGMVVGLGTGSTALVALHVLAERIRNESLRIVGIPTSVATESAALELQIPIASLAAHPEIDLAFDGADQVDAGLRCIKGYGGALLREKIVARCAQRFLVMVDPSKLSPALDKPVPVEVVPFGAGAARVRLEALGGKPKLRLAAGSPYVTDNGNQIFDVDFGRIDDPGVLAPLLDALPGVVDHGLFVDLVTELHVGEAKGALVMRRLEKLPPVS
jgi:ribose 5-phosphate isomerase A